MTETTCFKLSIENNIAHLVLNRPEAFNAMPRAFWNELPAIVYDINDNARARVIVISSTGKHFTAGMDISVFTDGEGVSASGGDQYTRAEAFRHLFTLARGLPAGRVAFAAGDFNVSAGEEGSHPVTSGGEGGWVVAHREGCGGCRGTHYYAPEREWSFLDMILLSAALDPQRPGSGWRLQPGSVRVAKLTLRSSTASSGRVKPRLRAGRARRAARRRAG